MKALKWFLYNGLFAVMLYLGLVQGIQGARYVALFIAWFACVGGFCILIPSVKKEAMKSVTPSVPRWLDVTFDMCVLGVLVWYGHFVLGAFYVLHVIAISDMWKGETK